MRPRWRPVLSETMRKERSFSIAVPAVAGASFISAVMHAEWEPWLEFFLEVVRVTADEACTIALRIQQLFSDDRPVSARVRAQVRRCTCTSIFSASPSPICRQSWY